MDNDTDDELVASLLRSKSKIWEDKKRLGLLKEHNYKGLGRFPHHSPVHVESDRSQRSKEEHNICDGVCEREKELLISCISSDSLGFGHQKKYKITGYSQATGYSPLTVNDGGLSPVASVAHTPRQEISVLPAQSQYPPITTIATQTSARNVRLPKYEGVPSVDTSAAAGIIALPQHASYLPRSPRERKMVEFRESYNPSFLQDRPFRPGAFDMNMDIRHQREAYQEELRRQIEEKQRTEAEQRKKEKEEEQAIARRAELQQERMRQEYVQEEALRRERRLQRMYQAEEFQHRQKPLNLEQEAEKRQLFEKRFEDLEAGLPQHTSCSVQSLGVPGLRAKYFLSESPKESVPSSHTASISQDVPEDVTYSSLRNSNTRNRNQNDGTANIIEDNLTEQHQTDSNVEYPQRGRFADCIQLNVKYPLHVSNKEYPHQSSVSDYLLNNCSVGEETSEPITLSYHRPASDIIEAAGYGSGAHSSHNNDEDEGEINALELQKSRTRHCELPTKGDQHISFLHLPDTNKCKNKLDDSLPVPILRVASPVIPAVRTGQTPSYSDAIHKLESKWQVPAVERNVVHANSDPNNILTQLGAARHQLQLEQMRMERYLQQRQKNKS
ncbi:uncharacterized protein LOC111873146 isoform X2 [Cryptotermes secundus]|uniref:uncharacterized protein LOC111873146 isoform X2 n=1 Tax=Cryptotermes secundus TaxID=105785 RepID=UPI001454C522|nr:uncharacterized protein LOC111873146 isoform X2 [Cryptotermes secundus]